MIPLRNRVDGSALPALLSALVLFLAMMPTVFAQSQGRVQDEAMEVLEEARVQQVLDQARDHHRAGRAEAALEAYARVARATEVTDPATAAIARNNRCLLLTDLADYTAAVEECRRALELRRGLPDQEARMARTLNNLGRVLQHLGRYDDAREHYREALEINVRRGNAYGEALNRANLGWLASSQGAYEGALRQLSLAEAVTRDHEGEPWVAEQRRVIQLNRGVVYEKLGAYREALRLYQRVATERDQMEPARWAALRVNIGVLYRNLGDPVFAIEAFREAAAIYRDLGDAAALANAWLNIALAQHRNLEDFASAEAAYARALDLARQSGDRSEEMQTLFYLGDLLRQRGRLAAAHLAFLRGLELARAAGSAEGRWSALRGLGEVAFDAGRPQRALELFEGAIAEVEQVRSRLRPGARRSGYFDDKRPVYADAVAVLAALRREEPDPQVAEHYTRRALAIVQMAKARELQEAMGETGLVALKAEEIQRQLAGDVVLELFEGTDTLYAWRVSESEVKMFELGPKSRLERSVRLVHRALAAGREPPRRSLRLLARQLIERTGLADIPSDRLWVSPDGRLAYLPFEILENPVTGRALVEETAVVYLPCASLLSIQGRAPRRPQWGLLGFGNPDLGDQPAFWRVRSFRLQPLPAAERELATVARGLAGPTRVWTGAEATEAVLRREAPRGARVLHLATHTLVDDSVGSGAAILLAAGSAEGEDVVSTDDGVLAPAEIAALDLNVGLTVLASCRSAVDTAADGRALGSLTGSLLAAGSSSVVATLWDVEDQATAVFMEQFYHQLKRGLVPSEALRQAKRRLRGDATWGRSHLWSAYVLVGDAPPVARRSLPGGWWWVLAAGLATMMVVALWGRHRTAAAGPPPYPEWF